MPLYMDVHHLDGPVTADDVAKAHMADLQIAGQVRREVPALLGGRGDQHHLLPRRGTLARRRQHRPPRGPWPRRGRGPRGEGGIMMKARTAFAGTLVALAGPARAVHRAGHGRRRRTGRAGPSRHAHVHPPGRRGQEGRVRPAQGRQRHRLHLDEGDGRDGRALRQRRAGRRRRSSSATPRLWSTASPSTATSSWPPWSTSSCARPGGRTTRPGVRRSSATGST